MAPDNDTTLRKPLGREGFRFSCHPGVSCFTRCCHDVRIDLRPYDLVRLKRSLRVRTTEILERHCTIIEADNPNFPAVRLRMATKDGLPCPFLVAQGCSVYENRPDACRTYPLERGISLEPGRPETLWDCYYLARQPLCRGHDEDREWTVAKWIENQGIEEYNRMNNLWAELEILFRATPDLWGLEGTDGQRFRMTFMALYDMDAFRNFVFGSSFLNRYRVAAAFTRRLKKDDAELLKFGHVWVKFFLFRIPSAVIRLRGK